jgi:hypothetical protein
MSIEFLERSEIIEECYEFMLAYAAQGLPGDQISQAAADIRDFLDRSVEALTGLTESCAEALKHTGSEHFEKYAAFLAVLDRDARDSAAALQLVIVQPSISSQLIDNLNASIHLRALLTDLFLLGEIVKKRVTGNNNGETQSHAA